MTRNIIQALIVAFLLFIIPVVYNVITHGGLIKLLGGITREELNGMVITLKGGDGTKRGLAMAKNTANIYAETSNPDFPNHRWEMHIVK
jgi:hypothetical protein